VVFFKNKGNNGVFKIIGFILSFNIAKTTIKMVHIFRGRMKLNKLNLLLFVLIALYGESTLAKTPVSGVKSPSLEQLVNHEKYSPVLKEMITKTYRLEQQNLIYLYGSDNPRRGGMDCSGVISYLLKSFLPNLKLRQANEIYQWVWQKGKFYAVNSRNLNSFEFEKLQPGDLLFWSGTYKISRDPPVTHVMLYLGKNKKGKHLMFGSSNGRNYSGNKIGGVSVFDFQLPARHSSSRFLGYSCIPFLTCMQQIKPASLPSSYNHRI
jgi:hypothetical protein